MVVEPISFMHEQSETLAELDHELREFAESIGKQFHRVPVPHESKLFIDFLADLVADLLADPQEQSIQLSPCRCAALNGVRCTNGDRDLPPSPFAPTGAREGDREGAASTQ